MPLPPSTETVDVRRFGRTPKLDIPNLIQRKAISGAAPAEEGPSPPGTAGDECLPGALPPIRTPFADKTGNQLPVMQPEERLLEPRGQGGLDFC